MIFKMPNCDVGFLLDGVRYDFTHVDSLTVEDPENTRLIRGANGQNKEGLPYVEGIKEPKTVTVNILGMSKAIAELLGGAYSAKKRMDVYCVDRTDGSSKTAKSAILRQRPQQLQVDETAEGMNVALAWESFDLEENHKS